MYKVDDLIMYGTTGVCRIEAISREEFSPDNVQLYYVLQPLYQSGTIYAPVDNQKVYTRPIISKDAANSLIDEIPSVEAEAVKCSSIQQLSKYYQGIIDTIPYLLMTAEILLNLQSLYMLRRRLRTSRTEILDRSTRSL